MQLFEPIDFWEAGQLVMNGGFQIYCQKSRGIVEIYVLSRRWGPKGTREECKSEKPRNRPRRAWGFHFWIFLPSWRDVLRTYTRHLKICAHDSLELGEHTPDQISFGAMPDSIFGSLLKTCIINRLQPIFQVGMLGPMGFNVKHVGTHPLRNGFNIFFSNSVCSGVLPQCH